MNTKKLIKGIKYSVLGTSAYYAGECDSFCGQTCDVCGRELETGFLFYVPPNNTITYDEVVNGKFVDQIQIGKTCMRKMDIRTWQLLLRNSTSSFLKRGDYMNDSQIQQYKEKVAKSLLNVKYFFYNIIKRQNF